MRLIHGRGGMATAILVIALLVAAAPVVAGAPGAVTRVSESYLGGPVTGTMNTVPLVSDNGRYVVFGHSAANVLEGDLVSKFWESGANDLFWRDMQTGETRLVNCTPSGGFAKKGFVTGYSSFDVTPDGRYVVFASQSASLTAGMTLTGRSHIYRRDMFSNETTLVSSTATGQPGDSYSFQPSISDDGSKVAFMTESANFFPDTNDDQDVVVKNLTSGRVSRVSFRHDGQPTDGGSCLPAISGDGKKVAFLSRTAGIVEGDTTAGYSYFMRDLATGGAEAIDVLPDGSENTSSTDVLPCDLDYTGRHVIFISAENLAPGATGTKRKAFVRDMVTDQTQLVSGGWGGVEANDHIEYCAMGAGGRYAVFCSKASNLVPNDTNEQVDIFIKDLQLGTIALVSLDELGGQLSQWAYGTDITADGRKLAFVTGAPMNGGPQTYTQAYLKDMPALTVSTSCSLTCESATLTAPARAYVISGIVTAAPAGVSRAMSGVSVSLQSAPSADATFTDTGLTATTTADGSFRMSVVPTSKTYYRVRVASTEDYEESTSTAVSALPMNDVGTPVAPRTMYRTKYAKVYGTLKSRHEAGSYPVRIYKYRYVAGKWRSYGHVKARAYDYGGGTRYVAKMRLTHAGKWKLRAYAPASAAHAAAWSSGSDYVTVK